MTFHLTDNGLSPLLPLSRLNGSIRINRQIQTQMKWRKCKHSTDIQTTSKRVVPIVINANTRIKIHMLTAIKSSLNWIGTSKRGCKMVVKMRPLFAPKKDPPNREKGRALNPKPNGKLPILKLMKSCRIKIFKSLAPDGQLSDWSPSGSLSPSVEDA